MVQWLLGGLCLAGCGRPTPVGTDLGGAPAPDFLLNDQHGRPLRLADLRGKVVVLTFLYAACPDVCPLIAARLRQAREGLGAAGEQVVLLAISVDPERDRSEVVQRYSQGLSLDQGWHYLIGERAQLSPIWAAYAIGVRPGPGGTILHTDAIYLIDRQGRRRYLLRADSSTSDLVADLTILVRE